MTVFDKRQDRLAEMMAIGPNVSALYPYVDAVADAVARADLVIGAVLIPGARAPHVLTREMIADMNAGSVVVDISVDQGAVQKPRGRPPMPIRPTRSTA